MCKICHAKVIIKEGLLDNIREIEIFDMEIGKRESPPSKIFHLLFSDLFSSEIFPNSDLDRSLKAIPQIDEEIKEINQERDDLKESWRAKRDYFRKQKIKQTFRQDEYQVLISDQNDNIGACSDLHKKSKI